MGDGQGPGLTEEGLGWDGRPAASFDSWLETTEPLAVGESNRAPESVSLGVKVFRDFEWQARDDLTIRVYGRVYARYSPNATHWSSWQQLSRDEDRDAETIRAYAGKLSVPRRQRESYEALVREYREGDVAWKGDEEAAVRWIAERDPEFLKRTMPFVGYVQILYETSLYGGHRIDRIVVNAGWAIPGMHYRPRRAGADKGRRNIPWRYRGPDDPRVEEPDWTHVLKDGRLHVAADAADTKLDLRRTNISDEGLEHLRNLKSLKSLRLNGTSVTDAGLVHLLPLENLTELAISGTAVTPAALKELKEKMPKLENVW